MTLVNIRKNGCALLSRHVSLAGNRHADVNVEALPEITVVPETGQCLGCASAEESG
jgi:hypothetical protein